MRHGGVFSAGDHNQIFNNVTFGDGANLVNAPGPSPGGTAQRRPGRWDLGIITVISAETMAMLDLLSRTQPCEESRFDGRLFYESRLDTGGSAVRVVATQTLGPGQRQTVAAYQHLRTRYSPPLIALVGIAGGIHPDAGLGDVVVATRVFFYDSRREDPGQTRFRGESHEVPPEIQHSINAFFSRFGEPARLRRREGRHTVTFNALPGPIGSGEAVIRDENNGARLWLHLAHDKTLAVDMESAGLAHAFHEDRDADFPPRGWIVIRGISDHADQAKDDSHHAVAARNAAHTFAALLPYLVSGTSTTDAGGLSGRRG